MQSQASRELEETKREIEANFSVIYSTLRSLYTRLVKPDFHTSYYFISENIKNTVTYLQKEISSIEEQAMALERIYTSSTLQLSFYRLNPRPIFIYRDVIRRFCDNVRSIVDNLYANISRTLAAYIFVYETLEKFELKTPFVLIESNEFLEYDLTDYVFNVFDPLGEKPRHKPTAAKVITYSGIDLADPLSLLLIGHETFHIVDRMTGIFDSFCQSTRFVGDESCRDAFVDIMCSLYYGPAYASAAQRHFQKRYPLSGQSHLEMNIRLLILSFMISKLVPRELAGKEEVKINAFIKTLENRMDKEVREKADHDKKRLDQMLDKGVLGSVKSFFKQKGISTYDEFVSIVEKREFSSEIGKMDRKRIVFMLKTGIPVAIRPVTLLNDLWESGDIERVESRIITDSFKKWYVRRYYQKSIEKSKGRKMRF